MGSRRFNVVSYLGSLPLFKDMSAPDIARIAAASRVKRLARGDDVFRAGQSCEGLYLVVGGLIKLFVEGAAGQQKVLSVVGAGDSVAEALVFGDEPHSVNARVLFDTQLLIVPKEALVRELEHDPRLAMRLLTGMSRRLNGLVKDIEAVTMHSGVKRVIDYLLHSPVVSDEPKANEDVTVSLPASKGTIASLLSVTPEHFSRILHDLQARGLISVERRHIHIRNAQDLAQYA